MRREMFLKVFVVVVCFIGMTIASALAVSPPGSEIEKRIANQHKRIDEGIKSGALTHDEAKVLQGNLRHIQQEEERLRADGKLTQAEKERLNRMLDQNGQMISNKKHNPVVALAPHIQERIANQHERIDEGIKSGALTHDEAKVLQGNLRYIQQEEERLTADGKLTQVEKERLNNMLDQNSQMIYDKKHNRVKRLY